MPRWIVLNLGTSVGALVPLIAPPPTPHRLPPRRARRCAPVGDSIHGNLPPASTDTGRFYIPPSTAATAATTMAHTYTHTHIHTYTHTHIHTYTHTYIHTYTHTHMEKHDKLRYGAVSRILWYTVYCIYTYGCLTHSFTPRDGKLVIPPHNTAQYVIYRIQYNKDTMKPRKPQSSPHASPYLFLSFFPFPPSRV